MFVFNNLAVETDEPMWRIKPQKFWLVVQLKMMRLLVVSSVILAIQGAAVPAGRPSGKIVGGETAEIYDAPWQIAIEHKGEIICGGSIISTEYVLTSGHCVDGKLPPDLKVRSGTGKRGEGGLLSQVGTYTIHPDYGFFTNDNDVAVILLTRPLTFSTKQQAVNLRLKEPAGGKIAKLSGWGTSSNDGDYAEVIQIVELPIMSRKECNLRYNNLITENMICAGDATRDFCSGDGGNALTVGKAQVGIVAFHYGCASEEYPGVYTSVSAVGDFIDLASRNQTTWV